MQSISDWLPERRAEHGWSQTDLGRASDIDPSNITRWESGLTRPSPANLAKLAPALGVPYAELMQRCGYLPDADLPLQTELQARLQRLGLMLSRYPRDFWLAVLKASEQMAQVGEVLGPPVSVPKRGRVSAPISRLTRASAAKRGGLTSSKYALNVMAAWPTLEAVRSFIPS